jgi:hypothetical protein
MITIPEAGPYSRMTTGSQAQFPAIVNQDAAQALIDDSPSNSPLLGIDGDGEPVSVDLEAESPHVLVSAATGGGKSVVLRSLAAQLVSRGSMAVILDLKRHSHRWARHLTPNIAYAKSLPEIGNSLVVIGQEVHRRNQVVDEWDGPLEDAPVGPRLVVLFEELNATMDALQSLERRMPDGEYTAMDALGDIMFMGRAAKVHMLATAQFASAQAMGGSAIRENFSTRVLIRYTKQTWSMLAYDCGVPIAAPEQPGRGMVCRAGKAGQTQLLYLTEEEAEEMVLKSPYAREVGHALVPRRHAKRHALTAPKHAA